MRILISGAGIAGPALAYWLTKYGFDPAIVEKSSRPRTGGYMIDFWGAGFQVAERMGILPEIKMRGYKVGEVRVVNRAGNRIAGFRADVFNRVTRGGFVSLPRGELAAAIYNTIGNKVETIFGESIADIEQKQDCVKVAFERRPDRDYDLVIGADGLHSRVRELVFGPESDFERYLGCKVAALEIEGYRPRDELAYVMYTEVGQQVARFSMRGDRTMFLFTFADATPEIPAGLEAQKDVLRARFGESGWECPRILEALEHAREFYFDRVSQIHMRPQPQMWTRGRVTLIGDAAFCVSLLAGQGSALAMTAAYILAGELYRASGDYRIAFPRYEQVFAPFITQKQKAALRFAGFFAPRSKASLFIRNQTIEAIRHSLDREFGLPSRSHGQDFAR